jgi:hypothetical protein
MNELINKRTVQLAEKYGVEIDYDLLSGTRLSEVNTFTYRLIGFGGKIAALPVTVPIFEWYRFYESKEELP